MWIGSSYFGMNVFLKINLNPGSYILIDECTISFFGQFQQKHTIFDQIHVFGSWLDVVQGKD
jgi:hypothetical protein